jgi:hypothetical protein
MLRMLTTLIKPIPAPTHGGNTGIVPPWLQWPIVLPIIDEPIRILPIDETLFVPGEWK